MRTPGGRGAHRVRSAVSSRTRGGADAAGEHRAASRAGRCRDRSARAGRDQRPHPSSGRCGRRGAGRHHTSRYFRTREAMLLGVVDRVKEIRMKMLEDLVSDGLDRAELIEAFVVAVHNALNRDRPKQLAMMALLLESSHRPALRDELTLVALSMREMLVKLCARAGVESDRAGRVGADELLQRDTLPRDVPAAARAADRRDRPGRRLRPAYAVRRISSSNVTPAARSRCSAVSPAARAPRTSRSKLSPIISVSDGSTPSASQVS